MENNVDTFIIRCLCVKEMGIKLLIIWNFIYGKKFICNQMSWNGNQIYLSNWIQVESIRV